MTGHDGDVQPEENLHIHGKALSGHRHSHALRGDEDQNDPDHAHRPGDPDGPWAYPDEFATNEAWIDWAFGRVPDTDDDKAEDR